MSRASAVLPDIPTRVISSGWEIRAATALLMFFERSRSCTLLSIPAELVSRTK